jgi:membrane protease YdiL (CAAX protease family)
MRPGIALWAYLIFVFVGAAALAPWVYHGLQALATHGHFFESLSKAPFRRIVNRCLLFLALAGIWPLIKALGVRSWQEIGINRSRPFWRDLGKGLLIGSALLWIAAACSLAVDSAMWDSSFTFAMLRRQIPGILATACVVALLEEILFRGALYKSLLRSSRNSVAMIASSCIYSVTHFFARPQDPAQIDWSSGFKILGGMLAGFTDLETVFPGFLSLTLVGIMLVLAFRQTGALYVSMGLHAALVFWIRLYSLSTNQLTNGNSWFWGTEKLIDGWFCFLLLSAATLLFLPRPRARA